MAGKRITRDQVIVYRATRQAHTLEHAAQIASISRSSAARIDNGLWARQEHEIRRPRRNKLSGVWDSGALPYLVQNPKVSAKDVYEHLRKTYPLFVSTAQRRTVERKYKTWQIESGLTSIENNIAFFHSAHQGFLDPSSLGEQAKTSLDLPDLLKYAQSSSLKRRNRAMLALAVLNQISLRHAWRYLKISASTGHRWAKIFQEGGARRLLFPGVQKPPKCASESLNAVLFKVLHSPPSSYGFARTNWRAVDLKTAMTTEGMITSLWTIRRAIRQAGYRWKKARVTLTSNDPRYREKVDRITSILETLGDDEAFFSVDEYGPFSLRLMKGLRLVGRHDIPTVPQWQKASRLLKKGCRIYAL
jgi:transposase